MEVILGEGKSWFARLIMKVIGYPMSHTALRYSDPEEQWLVHSTVGGVQPCWWWYFEPKYASIKRYRALFEVGDQALNDVLPDIAMKGYDYFAIIGFFIALRVNQLAMLLKLPCVFTKNPLGADNKFMCTEVIVRWLHRCEELDEELKFKDFTEDLTDPRMIDEFLMASEWFELIED